MRVRPPTLLTAVLLVVLGPLAPPALPAQDATAAWTPELSMTVRRVGAVAVSPDARMAAFEVSVAVMDDTVSAWRTSVHVVPVGAGPRPPVHVEPDAAAPAWSPDGRWLAFASGRSGRRNVWRVPRDGGPAERLTDLAGELGAFRWAPDGASIALLMTAPPPSAALRAAPARDDARVADAEHRFARLYVVQVGRAVPGPARLLTTQDVHVGGHVGAGMGGPPFDWAPDGTAIAFSHSPTPLGDDWVRADVSVVDVATAATRPLAATPAAEGGVAWSPDGRWIAVTVSDAPATYALTFRVVLFAPDGTARPLADSFDRRPAIVGWTADARAVLITEVQGTIARLSALPVEGGPPFDISPDTLMVSAPAPNAAGTHIGFVSDAPDRAPEPFASALGPFAPVRLARVQPDLPRVPGRTSVVRWRSFDGHEVEGLLTLPDGHRPGVRAPLLTILHGGPPAVFTRGFTGGAATYPIAAFAAAGFAVFRPNVRGSSGYGRAFRYANLRDWGGGDVRDVLAGIDALVERGIADADRLGVMGWSYGGYLTASTITQTTRFRAASVGAGITNLISYTGTADIPGFVPSYFGADYWMEPDLWIARSPVHQVAAVTTPTLIQHGERDVRVPFSQGLELYTALRRRGVPVELVEYPRQGHAIAEPKLQLDAMRRNLAWFRRWLTP